MRFPTYSDRSTLDPHILLTLHAAVPRTLASAYELMLWAAAVLMLSKGHESREYTNHGGLSSTIHAATQVVVGLPSSRRNIMNVMNCKSGHVPLGSLLRLWFER